METNLPQGTCEEHDCVVVWERKRLQAGCPVCEEIKNLTMDKEAAEETADEFREYSKQLEDELKTHNVKVPKAPRPSTASGRKFRV